ncbi:MAG: hypothetical protein E5X63_18975, partial [Mesorhizobium sp.]
ESPNRDHQPLQIIIFVIGLLPRAEQILNQSRSVDLAERRRDYEAGGWTGFDAEAEDYTPDEIERDRARDLNRL